MSIIPLQRLTLQEQGTHILIEVTLFNSKQLMVVDTGASKTVLDKTQLEEMQSQNLEFEATETLSTGLGTNAMESFLLEIDELSIEDWVIKKFKVAVLDLSSINYAYTQMNLPPVLGVIGGDILASYGAIINYKTNSMRLNKRKSKLK